MRIAVMGSGGIGGYLGARLAQAGEDVIFIARGSHLEAMQQNGLRVESRSAKSSCRHVSATERPADVGVVDIAVFAVKAYDTESAAAAIVPLIGPATRVVTLQNGVDKMRLTPSITVSPLTDRCGLELRTRACSGGGRPSAGRAENFRSWRTSGRRQGPLFALRHGAMSRVDVERTYRIAAADVAVGRKARL